MFEGEECRSKPILSGENQTRVYLTLLWVHKALCDKMRASTVQKQSGFPYVPWVICPWTSQRGKPCSSLPPDIARLHQLLLIWGYLKMSQTLSGWWFQPLWKILISQIGSSSQLLGKIKNVPNHQPVVVLPSFFYLKIARKLGVLHSGIQWHFEERKPVVHPWRNFKPRPIAHHSPKLIAKK